MRAGGLVGGLIYFLRMRTFHSCFFRYVANPGTLRATVIECLVLGQSTLESFSGSPRLILGYADSASLGGAYTLHVMCYILHIRYRILQSTPYFQWIHSKTPRACLKPWVA